MSNPSLAKLTRISDEAFEDSKKHPEILDVPMPGLLGKGPGNTLRQQDQSTRDSVLSMLEFHSH